MNIYEINLTSGQADEVRSIEAENFTVEDCLIVFKEGSRRVLAIPIAKVESVELKTVDTWQEKPTVVISGSVSETRAFCSTMGLTSRNVIHVDGPAVLHGLRHPKVVRVGEWKKHPELKEIEAALASRWA